MKLSQFNYELFEPPFIITNTQCHWKNEQVKKHSKAISGSLLKTTKKPEKQEVHEVSQDQWSKS